MPIILTIVFAVLVLLATIFAADIRRILIIKAIEWETTMRESNPEITKKLKAFRKKFSPKED